MRIACMVVLLAIASPIAAQGQAQLPPIREGLANVASELVGVATPNATDFVAGNVEVAARTTRKGPVAIVGTLRVSGTIEGDAFTYGGDIIVLTGGRITGSAVAIGGRVDLQGGEVEERREIAGDLLPVTPPSAAETTGDTVALTLGWTAVALIIGLGILVFGGRTLDIVGQTVQEQFGRSFVTGFAATLGALPLLALLLVALTLTILGILLIPFAIVAYVLAVMGVLALGFLSAVRVAGHALAGSGRLTARGAALRALITGIAFFLGIWLLAAIATPWPTVATALRVIAFALTWAAATVGLGATIISRAGTRTALDLSMDAVISKQPMPAPAAADPGLAEWTTPTPVSGVVAARRRPSAQQKSVP